MGGNVRVGLEDNLNIRPGVLAKSSAEHVKAIKVMAETIGLEVASPTDVRSVLRLKGTEKTSF
jgi:uncharacterized protein (DUF849 family)